MEIAETPQTHGQDLFVNKKVPQGFIIEAAQRRSHPLLQDHCPSHSPLSTRNKAAT